MGGGVSLSTRLAMPVDNLSLDVLNLITNAATEAAP